MAFTSSYTVAAPTTHDAELLAIECLYKWLPDLAMLEPLDVHSERLA
jgi:hypothetical protein